MMAMARSPVEGLAAGDTVGEEEVDSGGSVDATMLPPG